MDHADALRSPTWRPLSFASTSGGLPSSRNTLRSAHHLPFDVASMSSGGRDSPDLGNSVEVIHAVSSAVDIREGRERFLCADLTDAIRHASKGATRTDSPQQALLHHRTLAEVLDDANLAIRFHAKWFGADGLVDLLAAALDATFDSSSSIEVSAAMHLIDTTMTYSHLPSDILPRIVRFISQQYYNARKARKTKQLSKQVRTTLVHILESHLGGETLAILLQIVGCEDPAFLASKSGHAQTAGALMIIFQKLWLKKDVQATVPTPDLLQLVDALHLPATHGDESLLEQILETVADLLKDNHALTQLDAQCTWDTLISVTRACATRMPDTHAKSAQASAAAAAVDALRRCISHLDMRQRKEVADLVTVLQQPLSSELSDALVAEWPLSRSANTWRDDFPSLLRRLVASSHHAHELRLLANRYTAVMELFDDGKPSGVDTVTQLFNECSLDEAVPPCNAGILSGLLGDLMLRIQARDPENEPSLLFDTICRAAEKSTEAVDFILRIRADVDGTIYVEPSLSTRQSSESGLDQVVYIPYLSLVQWERTMIRILEDESLDWAVYDRLLTGLPKLLANHALFEPRIQLIRRVSSLLCTQLVERQYNDPPAESGLSKSYISTHLVRVLTAIIPYHRNLSKQELIDIASAFVKIAGSEEHVVSITCIYALTICCYEIPDLMSSYMDDVINKMSRMVTQRYVAIHVLEFLAGLSRMPDLVRNFQGQDYKKIFGICVRYLDKIRVDGVLNERHVPTSDRDSKSSTDTSDALPHYVYALAHHVMIFWYLRVPKGNRPELHAYIMDNLKYKTADNQDAVEDQGLVTIDIIDRVNAGDYRDDTHEPFTNADGTLVSRLLIAGIAMISTETSIRTGSSIITVRRASGTTKHLIPASHRRAIGEVPCVQITTETSADDYVTVSPHDSDGRTYGRISIPCSKSLLGLPGVFDVPTDNSRVESLLAEFDRSPALDSHKAGVIYIGERQKTEVEILSNHMGSPNYIEFVEGLGSLRRLKGAKWVTQGLDKENDADGPHAVVWHNEVTELVYHVTTLMPSAGDLNNPTANKKRHIGNDFVNIIFNNSGSPFDTNTFPSQFNLVWIVITPSARTTFLQTRLNMSDQQQSTTTKKTNEDRFYRVQIFADHGYPNIASAAEEKVVSGASLPAYVRNLALNECIFTNMWSTRDQNGEYNSSWRHRLEQIRRLRGRHGVPRA